MWPLFRLFQWLWDSPRLGAHSTQSHNENSSGVFCWCVFGPEYKIDRTIVWNQPANEGSLWDGHNGTAGLHSSVYWVLVVHPWVRSGLSCKAGGRSWPVPPHVHSMKPTLLTLGVDVLGCWAAVTRTDSVRIADLDLKTKHEPFLLAARLVARGVMPLCAAFCALAWVYAELWHCTVLLTAAFEMQ